MNIMNAGSVHTDLPFYIEDNSGQEEPPQQSAESSVNYKIPVYLCPFAISKYKWYTSNDSTGYMKHYLTFHLIVILLLITGLHSKAQIPAGNDWVHQYILQDFWKFPVVKNGIYRIDSLALSQAGVLGVPGFDPRKLQIFHNGSEIAIYVQGEADGVFNGNDYIEFFGKKNDATMDKGFYGDTSYQINKEFSLFTDTAYYFLTVGNTLQNKRIILETAVDFMNYLPAENYFMTKSWYEPGGTYAGGSLYGEDYTKDSRYLPGEGWVDFPFGVDINLPNPQEVNLQTQGVYQQGPPSTLSFTLVGRSRYNFKYPVYSGKHHHLKLTLEGSSTEWDNFTYTGYSTYRNNIQIPSTSISTGFYTKVILTAIDDMSLYPTLEPTRADRNSLARIELTFPFGTNLLSASEKWMYIPDHPVKGKTYLSLTNLNISAGSALFYDLTNNRRITVVTSGNNLQVLIPNSLTGNPSQKECFISSEGMINHVNNLLPLTTGNRFINHYDDFQQNQYDYLIISHTSLLPSVGQYAQYRKTSGYPHLYNPVVVDIESLYEQFSYGIRNNPLAIENFVRYLHINNILPDNIFIIGKGYSSIYSRRDTAIFRKSLVPGWGYPASDNIYINKLSPVHINDIAIGRLAAADVSEVDLYLDKVRQHEDTLQLKTEIWMKRAIHLGGGNNVVEQTAIKNSLNNWKYVLEAPYFGGNVTTFLKTSSEPLEIIKSQQLKNLINGGIRIMTFFGHGSLNGFDISTDEVSSYENEGRYPVVIVNSCYSGDLFNKIYSKSEEFVLTPLKGAIAYIGSANYSSIPVLIEMNDTLYNHIASASYGQTLGMLFRRALSPLPNTPSSFYHLTVYQQSSLHGDPALVLTVQDKPDYRISPSQVYFSPANVTNEIDSFLIHVVASNAGKALPDTFAVKISRIFPDKVKMDTILMYPSTAFQDTLTIRLPVGKSLGVGMNTFEVELDALYQIVESDETNNKTSVPLYIKAASLIPVYPYKFAIIPDNKATLYASTTDPFSSEKQYHFQISSDPGFTNPSVVTIMKGSGGIMSWDPPVTFVDSMVYFWRVAVDSADHPEGIFDWRMSSFQYIADRTGWSQAHLHQYLDNTYQYIQPDTASNLFLFVQDNIGVTIQTGIYPYLPAHLHYYAIDGVYQYQSSLMINQSMPGGFVFAVLDTISGKPMVVYNNTNTWEGKWGNYQEPYSSRKAFEFPTHTPQWRDKLTAFFDSIPIGWYVLGYSINDHHAPDFPEALYQGFEKIGSSLIRTLPANSPYIIFGRKGAPIGDPQNVAEKAKQGPQDTINLDYIITTRWTTGHIISTDIGPAKKWESVYWKQHLYPTDPINTDSLFFSVEGIDAHGNVQTFPTLTDLPAYPDSITQLDQTIDALVYPFIRLKVVMRDDIVHTPAQMDNWMVLYTPVGETALDPHCAYLFYKDTIQQGDSLRFSIATRNISAYDMDSLLISYWVVDGERKKHQAIYQRYRPHPASDTLVIGPVSFSTASMTPGVSTFWLEVNPINPLTGSYDQPEQTHINNIAEKIFVLSDDHQNPLLDVTFDKVHILDGDIVSARTNIEIQLNDENPYFFPDQPEDTALFRIYLKHPSATEFEPVHFRKDGMDQMIFYPATGKENRCRILFPVDLTGRDGRYVLRVEAMDKSQNQSGTITYQISFRVISEATITEVLNWPNPFSTKTHFVFTLTGAEVPIDFRIQIMTITGKMVRELTTDELGPLHVGRNITQGSWDGTDEFGDRLANGVYLYRVVTTLQGEKITKASSGADPYFREGWGKMYLMR